MTQTLGVGILFGIAAAVLFGSGDYLGGRAAKGLDIRRVMLVSQIAALVVSAAGSLVVRGVLQPSDLLYGVGAGLSAAVGLGLLYRALAVGRAGLVAPLTAVTGALVPVTWGVARGERPSALATVGVVVAVCAAALIAREQTDADVGPAGAGIALAAGLALGLGFVCYASTGGDSGLWPLVSSRAASVVLTGIVFAAARRRIESKPLDRRLLRLALCAGAFDASGTVCLIAGVRTELAVLVAAICALAPGFTVIWSWVFLRERLGRIQTVGIALALLGLVAIAAG